MDTVSHWKRILLQWIKECSFLDKQFYSIEQSEIDTFFVKFKAQIKDIVCENKDLPSFLREHYPFFEPHFDDENALSSSDYVYVYSLLLHFSCVKWPDEFFQKNCQHLNESAQHKITIFFQQILEANNITKETLRHAIASITEFAQPRPRLICMDSPMRTPRKTDISPPTPSSSMLLQRNRELHSLKMQLENELYERGVLDIEIKQNHEKIVKLSQELKRSQQQIQDLKNDLYLRNNATDTADKHSEEEQINRKLCKRISQQELELAKQREDNDVLTEQKDILNEKLNHAEKQMKIFQNNIGELAMKVDELTEELEKKDNMIQCISEVKLELEHYISEIRSSSASSRPDLNISVECLDISRTTNSSGSINSPENLGCSVVDIQLREKEMENVQLREEIIAIRLDNGKLSRHMSDLTVRYSKFFDICHENLIIDQENNDPVENFLVFSNYVEKFVDKYEENCKAFNELKDHSKVIEEQNYLLSNKVSEIESQVLCLTKELNDMLASKRSLETAKANLEDIVSECQNKLELSIKERREEGQNFENLQKELESLKNVKNDSDQAFIQQIEDLKANLEISKDRFSNLKSKFENELKMLEAEMNGNKTQNQSLISRIEQLTVDCENEKTNLRTQYDSTISLLQDRLKDSESTLFENEKIFETEKTSFENKILDLKSQYGDLEKRLLAKLDAGEAELQETRNMIDKLEQEKCVLVTELDEVKLNCDITWDEKTQILKDAEESKQTISLLKKQIATITDDQNQQYLTISKLQAEKEAIINLIEKRIVAFRNCIEQHENSLTQKLRDLNEQNAKVTEDLMRTEAELSLRHSEFDTIVTNYNNSEQALAEKTYIFVNEVDKLNIQLQVIMGKIETTANNLSYKDLLFSVSSDSTDAVNDLKQYFNILIQKLQHITVVNAGNEQQIIHLSNSERKLIQHNNDLEQKSLVSERQILELHEDLESDSQCKISRLTNEVKRLNEDNINLENVCERLTEENSILQVKLSESEMVVEHITQDSELLKTSILILEADRVRQLSTADELMKTETELRSQVLNMQSSVNKLEIDIEAVHRLLLTKTHDAEMLLKERYEAECTIESMRKQSSELQSKVIGLEVDLKRITEKYEAANQLIEQNAEKQCKELENLKAQLESEVTEKRRIKKELNASNEQLKNKNIVLENKCQLMDIELEEFKKELELKQTDLIGLRCEETRLLGEIELVKKTKILSETQVDNCQKEILEQKENVSRLIIEIASIRKEKEAVEKEKAILLERFEEKESTHVSLGENHKSVLEKLQVAEKDIIGKLNLLKSEQLRSQDLENQLKKLQMDNAKLKQTGENNTKRMEKQALKLGETQAKCVRLKKEAELAQNSLEVLKSSAESVQRGYNKLNLECTSLKEKLSKFEKLESKLQALEKSHEELRLEKENLVTSENELMSTKAILEKIKVNLEDKVRKLAKSVSDSYVATSRLEQDKVQLSLEVGGLNTRLQESNLKLNLKLEELQGVKSNLIEAENANLRLMELNKKLQLEADEIREENSGINDQLSKLSLRLKITQEEHENTKTELEVLRADIDLKKTERDLIQQENLTTMERLKEIEDLVEERDSKESEFVNKIKSLEIELAALSLEFRNSEEIRKQEKLNNEKLNTDISILQAKLQKSRLICEENEKKWNDEKDQMLIEVKASDDRIKETRLELEGKLEKMKNKMKTLYNDEITKMKSKQEREMAGKKTEFNTLKAQNEKYEEHIKKLSNQIFRLNENILEHQKQNTFFKTKLKDLETKPRQFNRKAITHAPQSSALGSNLHMEDEEGEVFNNTYLSDLKNGRMSEFFSRDISAEELKYRNSLLPPHLKSTYLAQFDHQMGEDEIRENISLDDSLSTLLNTGQRKKVSGATSYKRPGPPTPSKNAGRLSFGGNGELNREILKESHDLGSGPSHSKTPAKFKLFSSILNMKDEPKHATAFKRKQRILCTLQCSSTPRKSKAHFDQRRLLDQIMSIGSPGPEDSGNGLISPPINLPSSTLKNLELTRRISQKWRQPKASYGTTDSGTSDANSPICKDVKQEGGCKRLKRAKDRRGSIHLRGSMFARNCRTPSLGFREVFKNKSKVQRNANFNKYRNQMLNHLLVKKASLWPTCAQGNDFLEAFNNNNNNITIEDSKDSNFCSQNSGVSDDVNNDKSSKHFQQLLINKESQAPFEISEINGPSYVNGNSSSTVHSRTIYGASVILNRRIPNVNTTLVRKSSIYVKGKDGHGIILVTNQTITLVDLAQMWIQMNISAKLVIGLGILIFSTVFFYFVFQLFYNCF